MDIIEAFLASVTIYPRGSLVELTDRTVGVVIRTNAVERLKPMVVIHEPGGMEHDRLIIELAKNVGMAVRLAVDAKAVDRTLRMCLPPNREFGYVPTVKADAEDLAAGTSGEVALFGATEEEAPSA